MREWQHSDVREMKRKKVPQSNEAGAKKQRQKGDVERRTSEYIGVSWHISSQKYGVYCKWKVQICHKGVQRSLGYYPVDQEKQAAERYDVEARKLHGAKARLNFPRPGEREGAAQKRRTKEQMAADKALAGARKSKYVGVSWNAASGKWLASIRHEGKQRSLGWFPAEQEKQAAECYDAEARKVRGAKAKLNFPREGEVRGAARTMRTKEQMAADRVPRYSKYVGVSWNGKEGKWQVAISHSGVGRNIGSFPLDQEKDAAMFYDAEARRLRGADSGWLKLNFPRAGELKGAAKNGTGGASGDGQGQTVAK